MDPREEKLWKIINESQPDAISAMESIEQEWQNRKDYMVKPAGIGIDVDNTGIHTLIKNGQESRFSLTDHSRRQLLQMASIPVKYADLLMERGEFELLKTNLETLVPKLATKDTTALLVRTVGSTIKGLLSSAYKRMDASPIFKSFHEAAAGAGYVPYRGYNTSYRYHLGYIYPKVFNPTEDEYIAIGVSIITGDYGGVAKEIGMFILRISCTNLSLGYNFMRKIHVGKRFELGNEDVELISDKTRQLDTRAMASAVGDLVTHSTKYIEKLNNMITAAAEKEVPIEPVLVSLRKRFSKDIVDSVEGSYKNLVTELLPEKKSVWRLSNAMSLVAQKVGNSDTRIDLEKAAMDILVAHEE